MPRQVQRPWGRKEVTERRKEGGVIENVVRVCVCVRERQRQRQRQTLAFTLGGWESTLIPGGM